jgi:hypothetical protein
MQQFKNTVSKSEARREPMLKGYEGNYRHLFAASSRKLHPAIVVVRLPTF